jgi:hypothetical protein
MGTHGDNHINALTDRHFFNGFLVAIKVLPFNFESVT